jgi:hypothetical protein
MYCMGFYTPAVAGEVKVAFTAGTLGTLTEVSACAAGAKAAKVEVRVNGLAVLKESASGKKGEPEVYGRAAFVENDLVHVKKGDIVELLVTGGDKKAPIEGVTIVLTLA